MTVNSLLPAHYDTTEHALDKTCGTRLADIPDIADPWNVDECPEELLNHLAYQVSVDIWDWNWPPSTKREVISVSLENHRIKGTVASIKNLLRAASYGEVDIIEGRNRAKYDGTYKYDGVKTHDDPDTWPQNVFIFNTPISNGMAQRFITAFY
ncbi:phage tail protein I [Candidatus Endobugula sertula]|uniref:Phage tail protein I n=1 Tax=Candidatus Endobugula sertula TaxID=62101 RepID=A0A1D2QMU0_9GAMM|nr:phage tail protein I [Candidatus Endobugula sertula]